MEAASMSDEDSLLTASGAARILGLTRQMVRIHAEKGRLPATRTDNGFYLFRRSDVEAFARSRNQPLAARKGRAFNG